MRAKLTKVQAAAIARAAAAVPDGIAAAQYQVQLPIKLAKSFKRSTSKERGQLVQIGSRIDQDGYLVLYRIIDALDGNIISTIVGDDITIVTRAKSYQGQNQFELLIEIIEDLCNEKCQIESGYGDNNGKPEGTIGADTFGRDDF
jgi:hypothetical protein